MYSPSNINGQAWQEGLEDEHFARNAEVSGVSLRRPLRVLRQSVRGVSVFFGCGGCVLFPAPINQGPKGTRSKTPRCFAYTDDAHDAPRRCPKTN